MKYPVKIILLLVILWSCKKQDDESLYKGKIAVDAWIDEGGYPYVFLTAPTQFASVIDSASYFDVVLTKAKVTIRTDDDFEVLTLKRYKQFFPQHYYRANYLKGVAGKTYYLEIVMGKDTITSHTTIPKHIAVQKAYFERDIQDSTKGFIWVGITDPADELNYYRSFTKNPNTQYRFVATHLSVLADESFNGRYVEFPLYQGLNSNVNKSLDYRFSVGDTLDVKICTMDKESYRFWSGYEREMFNAGNPFGAEGINLKSNINGGLGVFTGYGVTTFQIITK